MNIQVGSRVREVATGREGVVKVITSSLLYLVQFDDSLGITRRTPPNLDDVDSDEYGVFIADSDRLSIRTRQDLVAV